MKTRKNPPPNNKTHEKPVEKAEHPEHQSKLTSFKFTTTKNSDKTCENQTSKTPTKLKKQPITNIPKSTKSKTSSAKKKSGKKEKN